MGFASQEFASFAGNHSLHKLVETFDAERNRLTPQSVNIIRQPEGSSYVSCSSV